MKKFLSLVLALVMTMSLVTISAGAKDFTDADKVTYTEAVDVLSAVKVIDGYTDGAFKPTNQLNRGQAAKILCNMILGPTTASALKADAAPFKDVPADSTFAAYIAYCAKEGIIDGYTDGTFRPTAPLTGYAFMKLLLGALGYDKDVEGYNQPNWSINVAKRALAIGLDKGLAAAFDGTKIVTREEACLYALNTMKADMVEYDAKTSVSVGGAEVVIAGSKAKEVVNNAKVETIDEDDVLQFAEKYFTNLKLDDTARDDFARPSNLWKLKAEKIGTYPKTPDLSYTKKVESGDIYSDLGLGSTIVAKNVDVYVDGVAKANNVSLMKGGESTMGVAANGVLTEVYYDDKADTADIIQVNTYIGQVAKTVKATDAKDAYIVITPEAKRPAGGSGMEFETDEVFEDDAYVLYTYSMQGKGAVKSAVVAETVEGTVTACENKIIDGEKSQNVTIDGETYKVAAQFTGEEIGNVTVKSDYKVYLDKYGYMIKIEEVENLSADYALVMALRGQNDFDSNRAKLLFGDGTVKVVDTAKDYTKASNKVSTWDIVSYKEENGVYTLKSVPATSQYTATEQVGGEFELINSKAGIKLTDDVAGTKTLNANSKTTFVVYDLKDDEIDAYTGVKTVPTIKTKAAINADVYAYCKNGTMTTIMFVLADNDGIIEDENNKSLYVANESASNLIHNSTGDYFEYNAVVGGEITTVKVDDGVTGANDLKGMFKSYTTNSKGVITGLTAYSGANIFGDGSDKEYLTGTGISKTSADYTVTLGTTTGPNATLTVDDDAKIYYVDKDGKISESSYSAIAVDDNDVVYAYTDEYLVKTLYIEEVEVGVDDTYNGGSADGLFTYTARNYNGYGLVDFTVKAPEYAGASTTVRYTVKILADGAAIATKSGTITTSSASSKQDQWTGWVYDADAEITAEVTITVDDVAVKYINGDTGKVILFNSWDDTKDVFEATMNRANTNGSLSATGAAALKFQVATDTTTPVTLKYTITGLADDTNITDKTLFGTSNQQQQSVTKKAAGNQFVVVTIYGISDLVENYDITAASGLTADKKAATNYNNAGTPNTATAKTMDKFGVTGATTDKLTVKFTNGSGTNKVKDIVKGDQVCIVVDVTGTTDAAAYNVNVKVSGTTYTFSNVTAATNGTKWITVNSDLEIQDITVTKAVSCLAITAAEVSSDGRTMTVTFNEPVGKTAPAVIEDSDFTVTARTSGAVITNVAVNGKVVTLTFSTALKDGEKVQATTNFYGGGISSNTCTNTATVREAAGVYSACTIA